MNFNFFIDYLRSKSGLQPNLEPELQSRIREMTVTKGSHLLYPGEICKHIYYLHSGFFRIYKNEFELEETTGFVAPQHFITAMRSFFMQQESNEGIICEQDAVVFRLSYHDWLALEDLSPQFMLLSKTIMQEYLLQLHAEKNIYRTSNATQKYLYLCEYYKGIGNLVSQKDIASYLGITPPTLSNLIKDLLRKGK